MKLGKLTNYAGFVLLMAGVLAASQREDRKVLPPDRPVRWSNPATGHGGRPLTSAESTLIEQAIDSIGTPPPDSISFLDGEGNQRTWSCEDIAYFLREQLRSGRMEAETLKPGSREHACTKADGKESSGKDQVNISDSLLKAWGQHDSLLIYLEETIIHEYVHKRQQGDVLKNKDESEYEAYDAEIAYKDSANVSPTDPEFQFALKNFMAFSRRLAGQHSRAHYIVPARSHVCYISYDTTGGAADDSLISFAFGVAGWHSMPFGPTRASDLWIFQTPPPYLGPDHCLAIVCGGEPALGVGRIIAYDMLHGVVLGQLLQLDFGLPQGLPPMFFYSMTHTAAPGMDVYYVLDTLNQQILTMTDLNGDWIPDEIFTTYANAAWPGFEPLTDARGVDVGVHPLLGPGISVTHDDVHPLDCHYPYDTLLFLPDFDANFIADECHLLPEYEFMVFLPCISEPVPWAGDTQVAVYGTWNHPIEVWATDSLGSVLSELLGAVLMTDGVDAACPLNRALTAGEFILAVDAQTERQLKLATQVVDPTPRELTLYLAPDGQLYLHWEEVPGVEHYALYGSSDGETFFATGDIAFTNEFILPPPGVEKYFYRVTAER